MIGITAILPDFFSYYLSRLLLISSDNDLLIAGDKDINRDEDRGKERGEDGDTVRKGDIIRPTRLTTIAGPLCFR